MANRNTAYNEIELANKNLAFILASPEPKKNAGLQEAW